MAHLPASRAVDSVGIDPMFYGSVSGLGTPVARLDDGTETEFYPAGKRYQLQEQSTRLVMDGGVPRFEVNPTASRIAVMYDLQVTVKNYVPGSGQVKYTTWGRALYPGFNPTPNWQTVSESDFIAMYPEWVSVRNAKFGSSASTPAAPSGQPSNKSKEDRDASQAYKNPPPGAEPKADWVSLAIKLGSIYMMLK